MPDTSLMTLLWGGAVKKYNAFSIACKNQPLCDADHRAIASAMRKKRQRKSNQTRTPALEVASAKIAQRGRAMIKAFYAVVVSAIAAGCFVAFPILSEQVHATAPVPAVASERVAEHVAVATIVTTCGQNAWPYLEATCLRAQGPAAQSREVRLISEDRFGSAPGR
jgi:hypothetical protein